MPTLTQVYNNKQDYIAYTPEVYASFPAEIKSKYEWIHQPGSSGEHSCTRELYWRIKTSEDRVEILAKQEARVRSIPDGTQLQLNQISYVFDDLPLTLKKHFIVIMRHRDNATKVVKIRGDEFVSASQPFGFGNAVWVGLLKQTVE